MHLHASLHAKIFAVAPRRTSRNLTSSESRFEMTTRRRAYRITTQTIDRFERWYLARQSKKKIRRLTRLHRARIPRLLPEEQNECLAFVRKLHKGYSDLRWHAYYGMTSGIQSPYYIPEDLFYLHLEEALNPIQVARAYLNKNLWDLLGIGPLPRTVARLIRGRLFNETYQQVDITQIPLSPDDEVVVKPARHSGGGRGVRFLRWGEMVHEIAIYANDGEDYIFQTLLSQHSDLERLNPSSVNTLRIITVRLGRSIAFANAALRVGRNGGRTDNQHAGGIVCGIRNGVLSGIAVDRFGQRFESHPDSGEEFRDFIVPGFQEAIGLCLDNHSRLPDLNMVSWDVAIRKDGSPAIVELNVKAQGLSLIQMSSGPLFGDVTLDLLDELSRSRLKAE